MSHWQRLLLLLLLLRQQRAHAGRLCEQVHDDARPAGVPHVKVARDGDAHAVHHCQRAAAAGGRVARDARRVAALVDGAER